MIMLPFSVLIVISFTKFLSNVPNWAESMMMKLWNLTYSVYMIHISVQILIVLFAYDMGPDFFNTKTFFGCYVFVTLILGGIIYRFFEVPAQTYLRSFIKDYSKKGLA
jgi:peptidoglycan/LPS O-acetylase OafA/YrhL